MLRRLLLRLSGLQHLLLLAGRPRRRLCGPLRRPLQWRGPPMFLRLLLCSHSGLHVRLQGPLLQMLWMLLRILSLL